MLHRLSELAVQGDRPMGEDRREVGGIQVVKDPTETGKHIIHSNAGNFFPRVANYQVAAWAFYLTC